MSLDFKSAASVIICMSVGKRITQFGSGDSKGTITPQFIL